MGFEGANVLFDTWVHPLMMGLEEHLIGMFRGDSEFHEDAAPSHLGGHAGGLHQPKTTEPELAAAAAQAAPALEPQAVKSEPVSDPPSDALAQWAGDAERELKKIPFFVRGKAKRNTERYALEQGVSLITVETLYEAKAHFGR